MTVIHNASNTFLVAKTFDYQKDETTRSTLLTLQFFFCKKMNILRRQEPESKDALEFHMLSNVVKDQLEASKKSTPWPSR